MNHTDYVAHWGAQNLKRWDPAALRDIPLPESSKVFLTDIGLPQRDEPIWMMSLKWAGFLPIMPDMPHLRLLALNHAAPRFALDDARGGTVVFLAGAAGEIEHFCSSSIEQFAECLTALDRLGGLLCDDPDYQRKVTALWRCFKSIDPPAIADPNSFWSARIFDMRIMA